jgi:hypothetical protein
VRAREREREIGYGGLDSVFGLQTYVQEDTMKCVDFRKDYISPQIPPTLLLKESIAFLFPFV